MEDQDPAQHTAPAEPNAASGEPSAGGESQAPEQNGADTGRIRSTIAFPYGSLKDAEEITRALHETWGGSASPEQLAGGMNASHRSGAFRLKTNTARTFGTIDSARGQLTLTQLGRRILDPQTRASARVEAFLHVPLFQKVYEEFKGVTLPPDTGLEYKMAGFGVSKKQTAKARQAFQRSAEQAGFFKHGKSRLVLPANNVPFPQKPDPDEQLKERENMPPAPSSAAGGLPAPLPELWRTLLLEGRSWSEEKTQEYVEAARKLYELLEK
jgi:hypothetical protein